MALLINDECIGCDACVPVCPNKAITAGSPIYIIDPELCTECEGAHPESQCVKVCPVDCIVPDPDNRESKEQLLAKYQQLHAS
jgi:ferredoxin